MASINGIAHLQLTVTDMARSRPFYKTLLHSLALYTAKGIWNPARRLEQQPLI